MASMMWEISRARWRLPEDTKPDFTGRIIIVTGANTGLGLEAALKFAKLGCKRLILGVRTLKKGEAAKAYIEKNAGRKDAVVDVWELDMNDYDSVKAFAARADRELESLEIVCLNAGRTSLNYGSSPYGIEGTLQVNTYSTALLGILLLPKLAASKSNDFTPVLELVSSGARGYVKDLKRNQDGHILPLYNDKKAFNSMGQYSISKLFVEYAKAGLAQLASTKYEGNVHVVSVCPGPCRSEIGRDAPSFLKPMLWVFHNVLMKTEAEGARTYISGVTLGEQGHNGFWQYDKLQPPAPLMEGEKGAKLQEEVWGELVEALEQKVPEVKQIVSI